MKVIRANMYYSGMRCEIPEGEHRAFPTITHGEIDLNLAVYQIRQAMEKMAGGVAVFVERVEWERGVKLAVFGNGWEVVYENDEAYAPSPARAKG